MKPQAERRRGRPTPPRFPRPFAFRVEAGEPESLSGLLTGLVPAASFIQLELSVPYHRRFLDALRTADSRSDEFSLSLVVPGLGPSPEEALFELRRLRTLRELDFLLKTSLDEEETERRLSQVVLAEHSGLRTGVILELDRADDGTKLSSLAGRVSGRTNAALSLAVWDDAPGAAEAVSETMRRVPGPAAGLRPVRFESCVEGLDHRRWDGGLACRWACGSAFVERDGTLRACRKSPLKLGNLLTESLETVWKKVEESDVELCLMRRPVAADAPAEVSLDPGLSPVLLCRTRREEWGATLIRDLDCVLLTARGAEVVRSWDGKRDLSSLRKKFGPAAVKLAFALYMKGLAVFKA